MPEPVRSSRWALIHPILRVTAEAGWLTVVYAALVVLAGHRPPVMGPIELAALVLIGVVIAALSQGSPRIGAVILIDAVVIGGILGWLASPEVQALAFTNLSRALGFHIAGWLGGLAVLRGATIHVGVRGANQIEVLLRNTLPGLAMIWAVTTLLVRPELWLSFAITAMWGTVLLIGAALLSIGLARLDYLHAGVADLTVRRGWRGLVTLVALAVVPIAAPFVVLSGIPISEVLAPFHGVLDLIVGLLVIPLQIVIALLTFVFQPFAGGIGQLLDQLQQHLGNRGLPESRAPSIIGTLVGIGLAVLTAVIVALAIYAFARWMLTRTHGDEIAQDAAAPDIERTIVRPSRDRGPATARRRFVRRVAPRDAVAAYVSTLSELERYPEYARAASETPAGHAVRMRVAEMPGVRDLSRLAAGYQLARYGDRAINRTENQRALARFDRIRRLFRNVRPKQPPDDHGEADARAGEEDL